jgi:hypothetical protein
MHKVHVATFYKALSDTLEAINATWMFEFPWSDEGKLAKLAEGFHRVNRESLSGCVLAVDGLAAKIKRPSRFDESNMSHYYSRKGFYALNVQVGCDADLIFRWANIDTVGSTHDSFAFNLSAFSKRLKDGGLPDDYYIVGDDAYVGDDQMVTPWPGKNLSKEKDAFNFQSRCVPHPSPLSLSVPPRRRRRRRPRRRRRGDDLCPPPPSSPSGTSRSRLFDARDVTHIAGKPATPSFRSSGSQVRTASCLISSC